jgi:hypothetical protein
MLDVSPRSNQPPFHQQRELMTRWSSGGLRLSPLRQKELEDVLDEADREAGIPAEELFAELRKYG